MTYRKKSGGKPTGQKVAPRKLKKRLKKAVLGQIDNSQRKETREYWKLSEVRIIAVRSGERKNRLAPTVGNKQVSCYTLG